MRTISFQVSDEFLTQVKLHLADSGKTLKGYIIDLITADLELPSQTETIDGKFDKIISLLETIYDNQVADNCEEEDMTFSHM